MADITADVTVSDILLRGAHVRARVGSRAMNGKRKGDGNTSPDWLNADFGTPDVAFQLRSERSGTGEGRVYTVNYVATDCSGNTTLASVEVRVPHDHSGWAFASMGFQQGGLGFDPALDRFVLIIPSKPASTPSTPKAPNPGCGSVRCDGARRIENVRRKSEGRGAAQREPSSRQQRGRVEGSRALLFGPVVNGILAASTVVLENAIDRDESWGAIGLHYRAPPARTISCRTSSCSGSRCRSCRRSSSAAPTTDHSGATEGRDAERDGASHHPPEPVQSDDDDPVPARIAGTRVASDLRRPGQARRTLMDQPMPAGAHSAVWDGMDNSGSQAATGVYSSSSQLVRHRSPRRL